jgi:hypothetical protein
MFKHRTVMGVIIALVLVGGTFYAYKSRTLNIAHSTFENYYAFRGCTELIDRTDTYGACKLADSSTIKIVKFNNKWYLDGDLPWACIWGVCFGI